jgi:geranylgeranyl diphosphate synthase, type II
MIQERGEGTGGCASGGCGSGETLEVRPAPVVFGRPLALPPKIPRQAYRKAQSNIPDDKAVRAKLKKAAEDLVKSTGVVPPLSLPEIKEFAARLLLDQKLDPIFGNYAAILVNNAAWRDTLATIPFERRLLLLPKCLRVEDKCPAPFDEFGLLCKECGLCSIQDLTVEGERLGYAVLVAEGSAIVRSMIETGKIDAVVGVSCINVLEKCFPHLESAAVPGAAIPLLQDDCVNTTVDLDWVWDLIHLTSDDKTFRLDLDGLKTEVKGWFENLDDILGPVSDETSRLARQWLSKDGKRWRPYLAACAWMALRTEETPAPLDLQKVAVAVECFHKASLVHDDIEDGDDLRYGEKTLHAEIGVPQAINVGDFLLGEGYRLIGELEAPAAVKVEMLKLAAAGHLTLSRGQGRELAWAQAPRPLASMEVLEIFREKTAPAFEVALRLGACLGGADAETHAILSKYSEQIGIAYQIKDDLEDHQEGGDSNDLEDLRPSLILAIAHKRAENGEAELLEGLITRKTAYKDVAPKLRRILAERGVLDKADELLEAYKEDAIRSLRFLANPTLKGLLRRVVGKIFGEKLIEGYCSEFEARNAAGRAAGAQPAAGSR